MKTVSLALFVVLVTAASSRATATEIVIPIELGIHHLGDDGWGPGSLFSLVPEPEPALSDGTRGWLSPAFDIAIAAQEAWLLVDLAHWQGSTVSVNGTTIGAPPDNNNIHAWDSNMLLRFDPNLLQPTGNIIGFHCGLDAINSNWDDFLFQNLRLVVTPEPATLTLLAFGGLVLRRARRQ